jgi:phosphoglycerol geranylgeranyltransferase
MLNIYQQWQEAKNNNKKKFVVLIDPDKLRLGNIDKVLTLANDCNVDYFFIGGSLIVNDMLDNVLKSIKQTCDIPMILFPGNSFQLSYKADALLFLSLISGRNAELLIGKHVITAPFLKMSPLEIISTGYMLIDGGINTTVQYMSNTVPIPSNKNDIAVCTAIAGELLGMKMIYMDAGSGAINPIPWSMIQDVSSAITIPLIVGGGIRTPENIVKNLEAGADIIVVGNAIEEDASLIKELAAAFKDFK